MEQHETPRRLTASLAKADMIRCLKTGQLIPNEQKEVKNEHK